MSQFVWIFFVLFPRHFLFSLFLIPIRKRHCGRNDVIRLSLSRSFVLSSGEIHLISNAIYIRGTKQQDPVRTLWYSLVTSPRPSSR
jgi:hypothetical protein